ncbi:MAG TPA: hypothetical protein VFQ36_02870 [Ktedonobacteraceae bacterium]|nr:hypothetical protein [Ktedonobacteraceae bacterium]
MHMGIKMDKAPRDMNPLELQNRCWSEIEKFNRKETSDDQYCLEIFRRALVLRDEQAWDILARRFAGTILGWLHRHPYREAAYRLHSEEDYVALTIEKLWMVTVRNQSLEFQTLAGALKFMRACLNSIVIDSLRSQARKASLPDTGLNELAAPASDEGSASWEVIKSMLPGPREQRLAYLLFYCNLKPRQVIQFCPLEFSDPQEIFQMKRNILDRLRNNKDRLQWLLGRTNLRAP